MTVFAAGGALSLPVAGSGLLLLSLAATLLCAGAFGELVFATGDLRPHQFAALTRKRFPANDVPPTGEQENLVQ